MFQQLLISIAIKALCRILGICDSQDGCPDGVCDEAIADLQSIDRKLDSPKVGANVGGIVDLVKCLDVPRFVNWVREGIAIFNDAKICVDDDDNVITLGAANEA